MKAILTQKVKRPETLNARKFAFMNWLANIKNIQYSDDEQLDAALERVV